jgi:hypothetical protein
MDRACRTKGRRGIYIGYCGKARRKEITRKTKK